MEQHGKGLVEDMAGDMKVLENNARMFATINQEAGIILPLLTQSFDVHLKGSTESFDCLNTYGLPAAKMVGKTFKAKVLWGACGDIKDQNFMWLQLDGIEHPMLVSAHKLDSCIKHLGLVRKMYATWKLASGK